MSNEKTKIAKNTKKLRKQRDLSHEKLSKLADISHNMIIKIESGAIQSPTIETAQKIARALGVTLDDLMKENHD
ncbi:MAG: helix-turn-helix transcriptional regulator [Candidatus Saccharicenans sp.]|nr:helix-turn-helix transcriptional regulator [Candidatus Saccharicenans sp.]MDI6848875.1 helix-turn-helix transcriptional regulator [Candidatus Saccharicenans sp.]